jgi:hypothetical protein
MIKLIRPAEYVAGWGFPDGMAAALDRIKWLLWHGSASEAIDAIECLEDDVAGDLKV